MNNGNAFVQSPKSRSFTTTVQDDDLLRLRFYSNICGFKDVIFRSDPFGMTSLVDLT